MPLYFRSYGDYKSAPYVYVLAAVFALTGPNELVARVLSGVLGLAAVLLLGLLAHRLSGSRGVGFATAALAAATPWLFEVTRLVFEVALEPALIALLLLLLAGVRGRETWSKRRCAGIGLTLALIAYSYAGGRALAPLLALGLLVFARGPRRRSVALTLGCFGAALLPMALFIAVNPPALFERYGRVSDTAGQNPLELAISVLGNWLQELNLARWIVEGDDNLRHHVGSTGSLLFAGVLLAIAGVVVLVRRHRWEPFWSYCRHRLSRVGRARGDQRRPHPRPALDRAADLPRRPRGARPERPARAPRRARGAVAALAVALLAAGQATLFAVQYSDRGPGRLESFHADFRPVMRAALATGSGPVAVYEADPDALGNTTWYGKLWNEPVNVLMEGESPAPGSAVVAVTKGCEACEQIATRGLFTAFIAR